MWLKESSKEWWNRSMHGCSLFKLTSFRASVKVCERKTLRCIDLCQGRLFNRIRSDCWHHLLHIFCHHKVDYILCIYKVHFFTVKWRLKLYVCTSVQDSNDSYYHYWVLSASFIWNKPSCTYTKLSSVLHWQAVMPALAYERQQLKVSLSQLFLLAVASILMAVFLCSCCPSLGPSLILFLSPKDDFPQSHMSVISIEHICIISGHSKYAVLSAQKKSSYADFQESSCNPEICAFIR